MTTSIKIRKPSEKRIAYLDLLRKGANGCSESRAALRAMYAAQAKK